MKRRKPLTQTHDWVVLSWIAAMHIGALACFFTFSWSALGVCLFLCWVTGGVGICLGYHRYFTHRSFETPKWFQYVMAVCGTLAGEAGPIAWVAAHRYHHSVSDTDRDPHSPLRGFWWAHMNWLFGRENFLAKFDSYKKYAGDMARDKGLVFLDRFHMLPTLFLAVGLYLWGGWSFIVWGIFVRSVLVYHITWLVNSAAHLWGYRTFDTVEKSTNNWWVAILSFGEGWHNNHHAFPRSARHGMRWWELDTTFLLIKLLWVLGLAKKIYLPIKLEGEIKTSPVVDLVTKKVFVPRVPTATPS